MDSITESELFEAIQTWQAVARRSMPEEKKHAAKLSAAITIGQYIVAKGARTQKNFLSIFKEAVGSESPEYARTGFALGMFNAGMLDQTDWDGAPLDIVEELAKLKRVQLTAYGDETEDDMRAELADLEAERDQLLEHERALEVARIRGRTEAWEEATAKLQAAQTGGNTASQVGGTILAILFIAAVIIIAIKLLFN